MPGVEEWSCVLSQQHYLSRVQRVEVSSMKIRPSHGAKSKPNAPPTRIHRVHNHILQKGPYTSE